MADRVQYIMDRMSSTFRQMMDLKIFNNEEIKSIIKRRTDFEYVLRRRQLVPADFYAYLEYELNLDRLRAIRCGVISEIPDKEKRNAYRLVEVSCLKHICYIFERAVRRFKGDIGLWNDYIAFLKDKNSISLLNGVFGKALSLHPKVEDLWLQAAAHELEKNNSTDAARILLQRSLRANKDSKKLWTRYFELELLIAVRIVERQRLLGLNIDGAPLVGAPQVVFKHAVLARPDDVHFACELHASSSNVSRALADVLEGELKKIHGSKVGMWCYLAVAAFDRVQGADEARSAETSSKKRRAVKVDAISTLSAVIKGIEDAGKVLREAPSAIKTIDISSVGLLTDSGGKLSKGGGEEHAHLPYAVASTMGKVLKRVCSIIGSINVILAVEDLSDDVCDEKSLKKRRGDGLGDDCSGLGDEESRAGDARTSATIERLKHLLTRLETAIEVSCSMVDETVKAASVSVDCRGKLTLEAAVLIVRLLASRIRCALNVQASNDSMTSSLNCEEAISWASATFKKLREIPPRSGALIGDGVRGELMDAVSACVSVLHVVIDSIQRFQLHTVGVGVNKDEDGGDTVTGEKEAAEVLGSVVQAVLAAADVLVSCDEGNRLLLRSMELSDDDSIVDAAFQLAIGSAHCEVGTRGMWAARYVRHCAVHSAGKDSSYGEVCAAWNFVESTISKRPSLAIGANLEVFYTTVLSIERLRLQLPASLTSGDHAVSRESTTSRLPFLRTVADTAVRNCPSVRSLWDAYEEIERLRGDLKSANHIRWKRDSLTKAV